MSAEPSAQLFRLALEEAPIGIAIVGLDGRFLHVNHALSEIVGYTCDELTQLTFQAITHPDDVDNDLAIAGKLARGEIPRYQFAKRYIRKDGVVIDVMLSVAVARDENGDAMYFITHIEDVSERKRLEQSVHDANADLDRAQAIAITGSWRFDLHRKEFVWSNEACRILHITCDRPRTYEEFLSRVHPDDRDYLGRMWSAAMHGAPYDIEHRLLVDGAVRWVREKAEIERDEKGVPVRALGITQDITERKRADETLRLSHARSSSIMAASADAIISIDEGVGITEFNAAAEQMFGYSKPEVLGSSIEVLVPERFRAMHREQVRDFAAGAATSRHMGARGLEIVGLRKNGDEFPADASISKIEVGGARVISVSMRDITEQARLAKEQTFLAKAGAVLAASLDFEATLASVADLAVHSIADVCMIELVEELGDVKRLRVASRDPALQKTCNDLVEYPVDRERPHLAFATLQTNRPVLIEHVTDEGLQSFAQNEGHLALLRACTPASMMTVPMLVYDSLVGVLCFIASRGSHSYGERDLQLAEDLARRAALSIENARLYRTARRAIQARDDLLAIVAHDLRSPLSTVRLQAQVLRMQHAAATRAVDAIERSAQRMDRLIEDLLDVSRMETGQLQVEPSRVSTSELAHDAADAQMTTAERAGIELTVDAPADLPDVWVDRSRILQVLDNLLGNSLKFTAAGGRIRLSAAQRGDAIEFAVVDTGPGLSSEAARHVFDRFWQVRRDRRGAGLGLAIAKGIIEAHGGRIWLESEPGRGTTFWFSVPVAAPRLRPQLPASV